MLDDILKDIARQMKREIEEEDFEIEVADLDAETKAKFLNWKRMKQELKDEMKIKKQELELRLKREMEHLFEDRILHTESMKVELWNGIYKEYDLDKNREYQIDIMKNKIFMNDDNQTKASNKFVI